MAQGPRPLLAETFLHLDPHDRREVYAAAAAQLSYPDFVLEKDTWICWALDALFSAGGYEMAFKGGTSLSKVFDAIRRFSEDIDLTVMVPSARFGEGEIPTSRNARDRLREVLAGELTQYLNDHVAPVLRIALDGVPGTDSGAVVMEDDETVVLNYPTCYDAPENPYISRRVKLEFGARNLIEPRQVHALSPYIGTILGADVELPTATVAVLSPVRTFWEKATLAHDMCGRDAWVMGAERIARHWYDLAVLADHDIGVAALADRELLADVVRIKTAFFNRRTSNYDACLCGEMRLLPGAEGRDALRKDIEEMAAAGMFMGDPPAFGVLEERLVQLEREVNGRS